MDIMSCANSNAYKLDMYPKDTDAPAWKNWNATANAWKP